MDHTNHTPFLDIPDGDEVDIPNHEDPQMTRDEYLLTGLIPFEQELTHLRGLNRPLNRPDSMGWQGFYQWLWELEWQDAIAEPGLSTFLPSTLEHIRQFRGRIVNLFLEFGIEEPVPENEAQNEATTAIQNLGSRPYVVGESDNVRCAQSFNFSMRCPYCRAELNITNEEHEEGPSGS
ncbi:hypothetical protein CROQUDRAFT_95291 [Cronartium quercuum f. sp. fusiforme G11]|uniref:Uncharacterized protein n=1 Tax=Cronartium quercuum f. sp. fusiforme G11 TaxID=708437 RepID=A0A9P6NCP7_9BASI|nr:hypothetical protein CROQUDRAFT_95291 [Cronartium quercuum f. sp. fusiforme G11]